MKLLYLTQGPQKYIYILNNQYSFSHYHMCTVSVECLTSSSTNTAFVYSVVWNREYVNSVL